MKPVQVWLGRPHARARDRCRWFPSRPRKVARRALGYPRDVAAAIGALGLPPDQGVGYAPPMSVTLCIETSSAYCSLALATDEATYVDHALVGRAHNEQALQRIDQLFRQANLTPTAVDLIGYGCGPGSFTGVRIAASIAQAVAYAASAQVVGLPTSMVYAASAAAAHAQHQDSTWLTLVPSRGATCYMAVYSIGTANALPTVLVSDELHDTMPAWFATDGQVEPAKIGQDAPFAPRVVGDDPGWLPATVGATLVQVPPSAEVMIEITRAAAAAGQAVAPELALPLYVTGDSPWRTVAERAADAAR